ncbi:MAG TPA: carbohydrate ABC transporter permease, partial [Propionibacteriaceae bacterium]|nr:carbohydrate ABC transporter permease [Propionibacteriaceae bacterium]
MTDVQIPATAAPAATADPAASSAQQMRRPTWRRRGRSVIKHLLLILASIVMIYPLLWMLASSFRPTEVIFRTPGLWLNDLYIKNYTEGWFALESPFHWYIINSAIVVLGAIAGNLLSCTLAAYAFARLKFRLRTMWFSIMLLTIMLPIHVIVVPQYIIFNNLGFVNTFVPLILPKFLATDAFFVFLMVQFIRGIPRELDEAAVIDGCGHWRIFSRVMLPLMGPAIATTAIFTFIWTWSDFFTPLIYLTDPFAYTVPVALRSFLDATAGSNWGAMF